MIKKQEADKRLWELLGNQSEEAKLVKSALYYEMIKEKLFRKGALRGYRAF